jgi:hypothetical protein
VTAAIVVLALLSTAILAVRGAMNDRRDLVEQAWREARKCALVHARAPNSADSNELRQCSGTARNAAELTWELPEHDGQQLELQASLDELVRALDSGDEHRLTSAIERSSRAGSALGWQAVHTRLH